MFLDKKFILANELAERMKMNVVNISSRLAKLYDIDEGSVVLKMNNCIFINSNNQTLPKNMIRGIKENEFTDMSNKLPRSFVKTEYNLSETELRKSGIITDTIKVSGKYFLVFSEEFVKTMKNKIGYVLDYEETMQCYEEGQIDGYIQVGKNKFFTWYCPYG